MNQQYLMNKVGEFNVVFCKDTQMDVFVSLDEDIASNVVLELNSGVDYEAVVSKYDTMEKQR